MFDGRPTGIRRVCQSEQCGVDVESRFGPPASGCCAWRMMALHSIELGLIPSSKFNDLLSLVSDRESFCRFLSGDLACICGMLINGSRGGGSSRRCSALMLAFGYVRRDVR